MSPSLNTPSFPAAPPPKAVGYAVSLVLVAVATSAAVLADRVLGASDVALIFVLPVVIAAVGFGLGPSMTAAAAGALAFNFLLLEPRYTFRIAEAENAWGFGLLSLTAAIVSSVAAQARRRAVEAVERADQAMAIHALARALVGASGRADIAAAAAEALARLFGAPAVVLVEGDEGLEVSASAGGAEPGGADLEAARWAAAAGTPTHADAYPVEAATFDFWPMRTPTRRQAVVGLRLADMPGGRPDQPGHWVEIVTGHLATALARDDYAARATATGLEIERERLKADLLAAVSHDLRTPLSTILLTLQSLRRFGAAHDPADRRELLDLAETETRRLSGLVSNLLDMGRLEAGAVVVRPEAVAPADLIAAARAQAAVALAGRQVVEDVADGALELWADVSLAGSALGNVLENAGKYAPEGSTVRISFRRDGGEGVIEVEDEGAGFPGPVEPLFAKFARGAPGDGRPPGVGLGLSIARGFLEAQGGRIEAANRPGAAGAQVRLVLPLAREAVA